MNEAFAKHMNEEQAEAKLAELRRKGWSCLRLARSEVQIEFTTTLLNSMLAQGLPQAIRASEDMFATVNYDLNSRTCTVRIGFDHRSRSALELFKELLRAAKEQCLSVASSALHNDFPQEAQIFIADLTSYNEPNCAKKLSEQNKAKLKHSKELAEKYAPLGLLASQQGKSAQDEVLEHGGLCVFHDWKAVEHRAIALELDPDDSATWAKLEEDLAEAKRDTLNFLHIEVADSRPSVRSLLDWISNKKEKHTSWLSNLFGGAKKSDSRVSPSAPVTPLPSVLTKTLLADEWWPAIKEGRVDDVRRLLAGGMNPNASNDGWPLYIASNAGHAEVVTLLLEAGANVNAVNKDGCTALTGASIQGQTQVVKLLLTAGANVNTIGPAGFTAITLAADKGHAKVVKLLLEAGANVNAGKEATPTPLYMASMRGHPEVVKLLLDVGAIANLSSSDRSDLLATALSNGHIEVVKLLEAAEEIVKEPQATPVSAPPPLQPVLDKVLHHRPMNYYYADVDNQPIGPCTEKNLRQHHQQGTIHDNSWVIVEGEAEWKSYESLFSLPVDIGGKSADTSEALVGRVKEAIRIRNEGGRRWPEAEDLLKQVVSKCPNYTEAKFQLAHLWTSGARNKHLIGTSYTTEGDTQSIEHMFSSVDGLLKDVMQAEPGHPGPYYCYACWACLPLKESYSNMQKFYKEAQSRDAQTDPLYYVIHLDVGLAASKRGDRPQAVDAFYWAQRTGEAGDTAPGAEPAYTFWLEAKGRDGKPV